MAEGGEDGWESVAVSIDTEELTERFLQCSLCLETFTEPKVLPCQHTFCLECLRRYVNARSDKRSLPCPLCQVFAKIPKNKVENFPTNFHVRNLIQHVESEKVHANKKVSALKSSRKKSAPRTVLDLPTPDKDVCGTCDAICVKSVCEECCMWLCETCTRAHRRIPATSNHKLMSLDEVHKRCTDIAIVWECGLTCLQEEMKTRLNNLKYAARQQDKDCSQLKKDIMESARDFHRAIEENCKKMLEEVEAFYTRETNPTKTWMSEIEKHIEFLDERLVAIKFVKDVPGVGSQDLLRSSISCLTSKYSVEKESLDKNQPGHKYINPQILTLQGDEFYGHVDTLLFKTCDARLAELTNSGIGFFIPYQLDLKLARHEHDCEVCCQACNGSGLSSPLGLLKFKIKCNVCSGSGYLAKDNPGNNSFIKDLGRTIMKTMAFGINDFDLSDSEL